MASSVPRFTPVPAAVIEQNRSQLGEAIELSSLLPLLKSRSIPLPTILDSADVSDDFKIAALLRHVSSSGQHVVNSFLEALHEDAHSQAKALSLLEKARVDYREKYPILQVLDDVRESIINVAALIPNLMREGVLTTEHFHEVSSKYVSHDYQVQLVLMAVKARGIQGLSTFIKCLRRTDEYTALAKILTEKVQNAVNQVQDIMPLEEAEALRKLGITVHDDNDSSGTGPDTSQAERLVIPKPTPSQLGKGLVVFLSMEYYAEIAKEKGVATRYNFPAFKGEFLEYRLRLMKELNHLGFVTVDMTDILSSRLMNDNIGNPLERARKVTGLFEEHVAERCLPGTVVLVYISGSIFPVQAMKPVLPTAGSGRTIFQSSEVELSTALLLQGAPRFSRDLANCLREEELKACFNILPTQYVTVIADCHLEGSPISQDFEMWSRLCSWRQKPRSVVFFTSSALNHQKSASMLGILTLMFAQELGSWIKRGKPVEITHRLFHQSLSLRLHHYWQKEEGKLSLCPCLLFVQGDIDRQFLGPTNHPPSLLLQGCHPVPLSSSPLLQHPPAHTGAPLSNRGDDPFNVTSVPLACGTVLGLREKESVEVYHVCRPEERFMAQLTNVKMYSSTVVICEEVKQRFQECIKRIYEDDLDVVPPDMHTFLGSICVCRTVKDPVPVSVDDPSAEEGLLEYLQKMSLVKYSYDFEKTVIFIKRTSNVGYEIGLEKHHIYDIKGLSTDSLVVSNQEQAKTIVASLACGNLLRRLISNISTTLPSNIASMNPFECLVYNETDLLTADNLQSKVFSLSASSFLHGSPPVGVLGAVGEDRFWSPRGDDLNPHLLVVFQKKRHISLIELRGNIERENHIPDDVKVYTSDATPGSEATMNLLTVVKMNSAWPQTVNFVSPVRVGEIKLEPVILRERRPICMQLRIKGNSSPDGEEVVVREGDMFRILFLNYHSVHVYINTLILEQTGSITNVWKSHRINPGRCKDETKRIVSPTVAEKLVKATMPHDLQEEEIRDTYKIVVSSHPLDLSSLEVDSPYEYFGLRHQSNIMTGSRGVLDMHKLDESKAVTKEEWCYCTEMYVRVRRRSSSTSCTL